MRTLLVLVMLVGCDEGVPLEPDASVDALDVPLCQGLSSERSFAAPVGGCCDESVAPLCATGDGICVVDRCVQQCSGHWPACPDGSKGVEHKRTDGTVACTCP